MSDTSEAIDILFQPAPPVGAETSSDPPQRGTARFQPAPPVGAETVLPVLSVCGCPFQPAPPVGAETLGVLDARDTDLAFQPAPPVGAETLGILRSGGQPKISTRSARGGGDGVVLPERY